MRRSPLLLTRGGLSIYTCVDPDVQAQVEQIYSDRTNLDYTSSSGQQLQSAITVIDNETGNLVGIAGRVGGEDGNLWMNFATDSKRQPGSSIKPLSVYAPAFEMGLISPISVLDDYPHEVMGGRPWPVNVDGRYRGLVTVRQALSNSYNTVSVRVLADLVTPENSFNFVEEHFHLDLEDGVEIGGQMKSDIGVAPLSMGGLTYGVNTRDMAEAFAVFPNGGLYQKSRTYTKVTREVDGVETVLLENQPESEAVLKSETAYYVNSILREVVTRVNTSGNFDSGMAIAGKTGTTDDKYDRWFVGYTPYYTAAVWVGFEQNERVPASGNPALKMWTLVMSGVHEGLEDRKFSEPAGLTTVTYCLDSGLLATDYCRMDPRGGPYSQRNRLPGRCADRILHQPHGGDHCYGMPGLPHPGWKRRGDRPVPPGRGILPGGEPAGSEPAGLPAGGCGRRQRRGRQVFSGCDPGGRALYGPHCGPARPGSAL